MKIMKKISPPITPNSYPQVIHEMYWNDKARACALGAWTAFTCLIAAAIGVLVFTLYDMPAFSIGCGCACAFFLFALKVNMKDHSYAKKRAGE